MNKFLNLLCIALAMLTLSLLYSCGNDDDIEVTSTKLQTFIPNTTWIVTDYKGYNQDEYQDISSWGMTITFTDNTYQYGSLTGNYYLGNNCLYIENIKSTNLNGNYIVSFKSLSSTYAEVQMYYTNKPFGALVTLDSSIDLILKKVK